MSEFCPHCGVELQASKRRSVPQLRRFHAMCRSAFFHWPDTHPEFRPKNEEHLRYWLTMRAGYFRVAKMARITSTDPDKLYMLMRTFLDVSEDYRLFLELDGNLLIEKRVDSIAFDAMGHAEFTKLCEDVANVIEIETGLAAETLLRETEKAA